MGIFGSINKALGAVGKSLAGVLKDERGFLHKSIGKFVGGILKKAAPIASFIPGLGPLIGAGAGILGNILSPQQQQALQQPGGAAGIGGGPPIPQQFGQQGPFGQMTFGQQIGNAASTLNTTLQQKKSTDLADEAIGFARQRTEETAPLRLAAIQGLQRPIPKGPDLSSIFFDPDNPFNRVKPPAAPIGGR